MNPTIKDGRPDLAGFRRHAELFPDFRKEDVLQLVNWAESVESELAAERAATKECRELLRQSVQDENSCMHLRHYRARRDVQIASLQPATDAKEEL